MTNIILKRKHAEYEYFKITHKTFAVIGIEPMGVNNNVIITSKLKCFGYFVATFIFTLLCLDFGLRNMDDLNEFTLAISLLNQLIIALWKMIIFFHKKQRIQKILKELYQNIEGVKEDELKTVDKIFGKNLSVSKFYYLAVGIAGASGLLRPIVIKLIIMVQGLDGTLEVPHKASFFWNTSSSMGYSAAFIWNLIVIYFLFNASVAIDTLFMWLVTNIVIQFRILKKRFEKAAEEKNEISTRLLIIENIRHHNQILDLAKEFDSIFCEIIFVKSLISCTQICFLAFRFTGKDISIVSLYYPFMFLGAVALQLMLYCYGGQLIKEESLMVSNNVFEIFKLSQLSIRLQKMLHMIMLRSQKSACITGIFFNLDLSLYLWFFKTAGSLIAVLKTMEDDT